MLFSIPVTGSVFESVNKTRSPTILDSLLKAQFHQKSPEKYLYP
ncbi:hypothetical protein AM1BK_46490 [Neobacillus kokaensis]|uniref:Uncharacterized protein n=1 Tax=Neobacillus kokaensis TaxID=2759023 RepID=A0ABQ3NB31_9BACI|nr:hypothetical protein AM1BK_46490 [Neobacillus kokaensis]